MNLRPPLARAPVLALSGLLWLTTASLPAQQPAAPSRHELVDVRVVTDEADAVLALLDKRARGEQLVAADWDRLLATEGYRRLKARAESYGATEFDARFREWIVSQDPADRERLRTGVERWRSINADAAARTARAYLPEHTTLRATIYPVLKKQSNSFVFEVTTDPAIFMYVSGEASESEIGNTLAHELHHIGTAAACDDEEEPPPSEAVGQALRWMGAFAEGLAVLAAAGGPNVHPHAGRASEEWAVWERDIARFNEDLGRIERFFLDILEGALDEEAQRPRFFELINTEDVPQGPFYTVGWKMGALVEQRFGRQAVIDALCDMPRLLRAYNDVASSMPRSDGRSLATWSSELLEAVSSQPPPDRSEIDQIERIPGTIPEGAETVLDRVVHFEQQFHTEIPETPRWCDRLELASRPIDIGDAELHVEEQGEGPPLVLIHGGPGGTHHYFHPEFTRAAEFARVIYYDQRGCGLSDFEPGPEGYSVQQAVADLDALREALGVDRWILFGYSYGGFLAQLYTIRHPERVAGLILHSAEPGLSTGVGESRQEEFFSPEEQERKAALLEQLRELRKEHGWPRRETIQILVYNWGLNGDWKRQHFLKPSRERLAQRALYEWDHDGDFNSVMSDSLQAFDLAGAFDNNPIPTLVVEGDRDLTWSVEKRAAIFANHPNARHLVFENAGHNIYAEQPEAFFRVLEQFVTGLPEVPADSIAADRRP